MLFFNLNRIFTARGIKKGSGYLIKNLGISSATATAINLGRARTITLKHLELLCTNLNCTPNDLLEWQPDSQTDVSNHPLFPLKRTQGTEEVMQIIQTFSYEKLEKAKEVLKEL